MVFNMFVFLQCKKSETLAKGKELQWTWSTISMTDSAVGSEYVVFKCLKKFEIYFIFSFCVK